MGHIYVIPCDDVFSSNLDESSVWVLDSSVTGTHHHPNATMFPEYWFRPLVYSPR